MSVNVGLPPAWLRTAVPIVKRLPRGRYRAIEWLCRGRRDRFIATFPVAGRPVEFICDLGDHIAREVCFTGMYEPQETALFRALVRPGMTVVDVGANWGYFTLLAAALVGSSGRVVALEPEPRLFAVLAENIRRNGLTHTTALACAVTDRESVLALDGFDAAQGNWGVSRVAQAHGAAPTQVSGRALDDLLDSQGVERVEMVKIDVEGHELSVLRGMSDGLAAGQYRRLLVEWHPTLLPAAAIRHGLDLLQGCGYRGFWIDHSFAATRAAAYGGTPRLRPVARDASIDAWPHSLWLAPGEMAFGLQG